MTHLFSEKKKILHPRFVTFIKQYFTPYSCTILIHTKSILYFTDLALRRRHARGDGPSALCAVALRSHF